MSERLSLHLDRMLESAIQAADYVRGLTLHTFLIDKKTQQAVVLNLMVIMRNRIAHGYFDIDMAIVWKTVHRDLPPLIAQLSALKATGEGA